MNTPLTPGWTIYYKDGCGPCNNAKSVTFPAYKIYPAEIPITDPSYPAMRSKFNYLTYPLIIHNGSVIEGGGGGLEPYLISKGYKKNPDVRPAK